MQVLHLHDEWFQLVQSGKKKYEGRRKTVFIDSIEIGETLEIRNYNKPSAPFRVRVTAKKEYATFEDALKHLQLEDVLPVDGITVERGVEIYKQYVSIETQMRDGVVMLKLDVVPNMSNKLNAIFRQIQCDVLTENWNTGGIEEMVKKKLQCILAADKCDMLGDANVVPRNGDLVVGFYLDKAAPSKQLINVTIGGRPHPDLVLKPGEFVYALNNTHIYPIIAVHYSEMRINTSLYDYLHVIHPVSLKMETLFVIK